MEVMVHREEAVRQALAVWSVTQAVAERAARMERQALAV